ncbi:hypothetical protein N9Z31_05690, partial [Pseudomonadales bacterium]|nr:hypothetical protein [Pseudomonadales bacterium]
MIKKQLGLLAGSVMVASSANAVIGLDTTNAVAVFNTAGAGSYYQLVPGTTGDSLEAGFGFSVDVSAATAALGGTVDWFALFAINSNEFSPSTGPGYNYTEFQYVSEGGGLVYAGDTATSTTNLAAGYAILELQSFLSNANLGFNGEGTLGDADAYAFANQYLVSNSSGIVFNQQTLTGATNAQLLPGTISLSGSTLTYSGLGPPPPSPTSITFPTQGSLITTGTPITVTVESGSDKTYCGLFLNDILIDEDDSVPYEFSAAPLDNLAGGSYNLQASCFSTSGQQASDLITFTVNAPATITGDITNDIEQAAIASGTITATDPDGLTDGSYFTLKTDATYGQALINPESGFWIY